MKYIRDLKFYLPEKKDFNLKFVKCKEYQAIICL